MKRKIFLGLLPALMALSACGGAGPNNPGPELFKEDTLLHEELFGDVNSGLSKARKNLDPLDPSTTQPIIGVQAYTGTEGYVSLRFVAAINIPSADIGTYTATWRRTMYDADGNVYKVADDKPSTKAFTSIKDNGSDLTAAAFDTAHGGTGYYTHFVVYSMLNIPLTLNAVSLSDYYLHATLSLSGNANQYTVATNVARTKQVSFNPAAGEYLLRGTINGNQGVTLPQDSDYATKPLPDGKVTRFTTPLLENDSFYLVYNHVDATPENSKFVIYDSNCVRSNPYLGDDETAAKKIKSWSSRNYVFYLDDVNELDVESGYHVSYTNYAGDTVVDPLTYAGQDGDSKNQFKGTIAPRNGSSLVLFTDDPESPLTIASQSGNISGLAITFGGPELDFYLKEETENYSIWCGYPECYLEIDGAVSPIESRAQTGNDVAIFDLSLTAGQKVIVHCGYKLVPLGTGVETEYTAPASTNYIFYVNNSAQVWVDELATVTFAVNYDTYNNGSLYAVGNFSGDYEPWPMYKLEWTTGNDWVATFELPVGKKLKLCVAPTENPTKGAVTAWESVERTVVSGGMSVTGWNVA